ncbi:MAG: LAGLIDADG family homing endonuclease [Candidatus Moranbacteria bacterium]|nr:LAGLIDADG family homing endonuclease [Candidatus Moranbacteria bacterium]MDD3965233.1 LAGLIDADG family homing endonuclease [Candidatus Moranbacteria bacterium]
MAEQLNSKRVIFPKGKQKEFLLQSKEEFFGTWEKLAEVAGTSVRNLNDWRNEKISMSLFAVEQICKKRKREMPENIVIKDAYWYTKQGSSAGGKAVLKKYGIVGGDPEYRKTKWREWWEKEGHLNPSKITQALPFKRPTPSEDLAEFVGIMLGDGGISKHQFTITLNTLTDKKYSIFVQQLINNLFEVSFGVCLNKKFLAERIMVSRTALITYLIDELGLKQGNKVKQQVDIPLWVKKNQCYSIACLRGLIDTDGCIILHKYLSKGKRYCYKKIGFTSRSHPLLQSASEILLILGIKHRIMKNGWDIRIEARKDVEKYFQVVGTHNPKHLERYKMA